MRQHCVTATGPGVSLEARRWRGRSRILLLSKASLGASGTRPITSTSYCVCFTRHTVYLSLSFSSTLSSLGLARWVYSTRGHGREESAKGILVSCLHLSRPPDYGLCLSPLRNIDMANISEYDQDIVYESVRAKVIVSIFYFSPEEEGNYSRPFYSW